MAAKPGRITEEIINAEYQAVYHYILSLCRDEKEAEDITQDTFVKAISAESLLRCQAVHHSLKKY